MRKVLLIVALTSLGLWGCTRHEANQTPDSDNPLIGTWVADVDAMTALMTRYRVSQQEINDMSSQHGHGRTRFVITKESMQFTTTNQYGEPFPYDLKRIDSDCFNVRNTDTDVSLELCVHGNSMRMNHDGPGLMLKRE